MKKEVRKIIENGTLRIKVRDLKVYEKIQNGWKKSKREFPNALEAVKLFKAHGNFKALIDKKDPEFLKGQASRNGMILGARINILPDGKVLNKAYSLFAEDLTIHDEKSNNHWDVMYKNPGGGHSHVYTLDKVKIAVKGKYREVENFGKKYNLLKQRVLKGLRDENDEIALPMYTLLETYMRVGNEIYYKANGHKGLTTLKKKDLTISGKRVLFEYVGKDGVPCQIEQHFPTPYVNRLRKQLQGLKPNDFVFASKNGRPLRDEQFKKAFKRYCGKEFYPHIIRSHHATRRVKEFLKGKRTISKEEMKSLFLSVASDLGHKRFVKKEKAWKDNYTVTLNHYIEPALVEQVKAKVRG